jgi:hypothetical protein
MSEDLLNEIEAINSIYGASSLTSDVSGGDNLIYILTLPLHAIALRLRFPADYPSAPPIVLGTQSSGERKGAAGHLVQEFRHAIGRVYRPGEVCLFDAIEEMNGNLGEVVEADAQEVVEGGEKRDITESKPVHNNRQVSSGVSPPWILSDVVVELKSVFIARCAPVSSPDQATQYLQHLLDTDKKVRSATHNITAWRIRGENGVTFQDCDDDGETAAGGRVLHLMQLMDLWDVMVVVTRWYGGHQLGPKRFSIINTVARDAFVKGGFVKEDTTAKKKGKH